MSGTLKLGSIAAYALRAGKSTHVLQAASMGHKPTAVPEQKPQGQGDKINKGAQPTGRKGK
jgi:hypothetical protein